MKQLLLIFFLIGYSTLALAQGGDQQRKLEERKEQIQKEIKALKSLINDQSSKEKSVLTKISDSDAKIKLSEKLISTTKKQTRLLTDDIYLNQLKINKLNRELEVLKDDYAKMILKAYQSRSDQSRIMFILSSKDFLEAYKRVQYMKQYASFRKVQGDEIRSKMTELEDLQTKLGVQKKDKQKLLAESQKEKNELEKDKDEQQKLVKDIQKNKKKYTAEVKAKQRESREIDRKIDAVIREAIAEANRKAAAKRAAEEKEAAAVVAKSSSKSTKSSGKSSGATTSSAPAKSTVSSEKIVLTKEGKVVSDNFRANKGHLPWPVEKGYVSSSFGTHPHPYIDGIDVNNKGIDITTEEGASVKAVFGGEVSSVQKLRSGNYIVCIQHGDYFTVYSNLDNISVSAGDKVSIHQKIGTVGKELDGRPVLKFIVSQNNKLQNPALWIAK